MRTVELFMGSIYKSGDIITGWYVFDTVLGKVSEAIVMIIDVLPTPSKLNVDLKVSYHLPGKVLEFDLNLP